MGRQEVAVVELRQKVPEGGGAFGDCLQRHLGVRVPVHRQHDPAIVPGADLLDDVILVRDLESRELQFPDFVDAAQFFRRHLLLLKLVAGSPGNE